MKPENQSDKLTEFYRAWLAWAEGGENVHGFDPYMGLCAEAKRFGGRELRNDITNTLSLYPFDKTESDFWICKDKRTNPKRLQWCRDHI